MILKQSTIGVLQSVSLRSALSSGPSEQMLTFAATFGDPYCLHVLIKHTKSCTEAEIKIIKGEVFNFCTTSSTMTNFRQVSANTSPTCLWLDKLFVPPQTQFELLCWIAQTKIKSATEPKCYTLFAKISHLHLLRNACSARNMCECELHCKKKELSQLKSLRQPASTDFWVFSTYFLGKFLNFLL